MPDYKFLYLSLIYEDSRKDQGHSIGLGTMRTIETLWSLTAA